ncbi:hypothetical protein TNCV_1702051 [Trichonephila clavipes]|nr:hypothetical protein TNCV_1702051 [Trichonephila clavipes]
MEAVFSPHPPNHRHGEEISEGWQEKGQVGTLLDLRHIGEKKAGHSLLRLDLGFVWLNKGTISQTGAEY